MPMPVPSAPPRPPTPPSQPRPIPFSVPLNPTDPMNGMDVLLERVIANMQEDLGVRFLTRDDLRTKERNDETTRLLREAANRFDMALRL